MAWTVELDRAAERDLAKLDHQAAEPVLAFLRDRLARADDPRTIGHALKGGTLGEYWRYRVGDYRVVASIQDKAVRILVVRIGNRREVYR
jgi:mRNA interferase RelE/StbE